MRILNRVACLLLAPAILAACAGGTSGSVVGGRENCRINGGVGYCEGRFNRLNGTYGMDIEDDYIFGGDDVDVTVEAAVESGTVRISVESPAGDVSSIEVGPGSSGTLIGIAEGEFDGFEVTFEAVGGEATGVEYRIDYLAR
ncbi:MAG: hypothetical protein PVH60_04580 [Anaerolineales bacterium]|jgi:hypothetical protein